MTEPRDNPPKLQAALKGLYARRQPVPDAVEDAILRRARALTAPRRARWRIGLLGSVAAAAVVLVTVGLWAPLFTDRAVPPSFAEVRDVNADGQVNVLDAMALARRLEQGGAPAGHLPHYDLNRDGRTDRADVDALALAAVRLEGT